MNCRDSFVIAPASEVNHGKPLTFAVFSCSRYQDGKYINVVESVYLIYELLGYFNAYGVAAHNTPADIFMHLGDYVNAMCHNMYSTS